MNPVQFQEQNTLFHPPEGTDESQVGSVPAYVGPTQSGSMDGAILTVTLWVPTREEMINIAKGSGIFMTMLTGGTLAPHYLSTTFHDATHPA